MKAFRDNLMRSAKFVFAVIIVFCLFCSCTEAVDRYTTSSTCGTGDFTQTTIPIIGDAVAPTASLQTEDAVVEFWTDATNPADNLHADDSTDSIEGVTVPTDSAPDNISVYTYEDFISMTGAQQQEFVELFDSLDGFKQWYKQALAEYNSNKPPELTGDGNIDINDILPN